MKHSAKEMQSTILGDLLVHPVYSLNVVYVVVKSDVSQPRNMAVTGLCALEVIMVIKTKS